MVLLQIWRTWTVWNIFRQSAQMVLSRDCIYRDPAIPYHHGATYIIRLPFCSAHCIFKTDREQMQKAACGSESRSAYCFGKSLVYYPLLWFYACRCQNNGHRLYLLGKYHQSAFRIVCFSLSCHKRHDAERKHAPFGRTRFVFIVVAFCRILYSKEKAAHFHPRTKILFSRKNRPLIWRNRTVSIDLPISVDPV